MKKFHIELHAFGHYANFDIHAEDSVESVEKAILDKIGEKTITWEYMGENVYSSQVNRITYEEVTNDRRPIQYETVLGTRVATGAPEGR